MSSGGGTVKINIFQKQKFCTNRSVTIFRGPTGPPKPHIGLLPLQLPIDPCMTRCWGCPGTTSYFESCDLKLSFLKNKWVQISGYQGADTLFQWMLGQVVPSSCCRQCFCGKKSSKYYTMVAFKGQNGPKRPKNENKWHFLLFLLIYMVQFFSQCSAGQE